jgi:hypothetical protein
MLMEVVEEAFSAPIILAGEWACGESESPDIEGITRHEIPRRHKPAANISNK